MTPGRPTRPRAARALLIVCALLLGAAGSLLLLRWAHVPDRTGWIALQTLSPLGGPLAVLALACALAARSRTATALTLVPVVAYAVLAWPTLHRRTVPAGTRDLTVLSSNLEMGGARPADLLAQVTRVDVDVLVLVEVTPEALAVLDEAGLGRRLPHRYGQAAPRAAGLVVLSRHPVTVEPAVHDGRAAAPSALVHAPGGDVLVRAVHPSAPTSPQLWRSDLAALRDGVARLDPQVPLVLVGDFNAGQVHPPFRELTAGLDDASRAAGRGWNPTWPQHGRVPPFAEIDHVLVRRLAVVDAGSLPIGGTDHKAVWARLQVTGGG